MQSSGNNLIKKLSQTRSGRFAFFIIGLFLFFFVFADFIANEKPIYAKHEGQSYYPIFNAYANGLGLSQIKHPAPNKDWNEISFEKSIWPLLPYSGITIDLKNNYKGPFEAKVKTNRFGRHPLGTGQLGKDVASGIIHGTRVALIVGLMAMLLAAIIGLFFGSIAGYFGDQSFKLGPFGILFSCLSLLYLIYWSYISFGGNEIKNAGDILRNILALLGIPTLFLFAGHQIDGLFGFRKKFYLPLDLIIMRIIEVMEAIPGLLLLFALLTIINRPSMLSLILIIALVKWPAIAKFVRAEMLRIRGLLFIESSKAIGNPSWKSLFVHALPNAMRPVVITLAFGVASAILLEASLSFLALGVSEEIMTWGKLLSNARQKPSAWWLAVFPGLAIFLCVFAFNKIGDVLDGK